MSGLLKEIASYALIALAIFVAPLLAASLG